VLTARVTVEMRRHENDKSLAKQRAKEVALREAVKTNNLEKIRILLSSNTNPNSQDEVLIDRVYSTLQLTIFSF